jgi:cytochrome c biogenesis protein CcdA
METPYIPPVDAELALAEVRARRAQVVDANLVPSWFWPAIGGLIVMFVAAVESDIGWLTAVGTIAYVIGLGTVILLVVRHGRVKVRVDLLGVRGGLAIAGFTLALVAAGLGIGFALDALGVPWPATIACLAVAGALVVGGPMLTAHLRRLMLSGPPAGPR